jgi:FKBP-type peptidyl-prolyl cis-trans isomerase 2
VGDRVQLSNGMPATITDVDPEKGVTLDLNHELAGGRGASRPWGRAGVP